jgi:hypothetical protein
VTYGWRKYVGYALLAFVALWTFGVIPHSRLALQSNKPSWDHERNPRTDATPLEARLGLAATTLAGREVSIRCDGLQGIHASPDIGGFVRFSGSTPANYAHIRRTLCRSLSRLTRDRGAGGSDEAEAVKVLAHESFHLRGVMNEAATECYALQYVTRVATRLGASEANAVRFHELDMRAYPLAPPKYRSSECRPGGALDLHGALPPAS